MLDCRVDELSVFDKLTFLHVSGLYLFPCLNFDRPFVLSILLENWILEKYVQFILHLHNCKLQSSHTELRISNKLFDGKWYVTASVSFFS